jgi:AbrB family looped-hinge helix DNA binding protein
MPTSVTVSSKNQIVIPRKAREMLHIQPGGKLLVLCKEDRIVLIPRPHDFVKKMAGLHKDLWESESVENYLAEERESWKP